MGDASGTETERDGPKATEAGPAPGSFMAAAERFSHSIAGGYGLRDEAPGGEPAPGAQRRSLARLAVTFLAVTAIAAVLQLSGGLPLLTIELIVVVLIAVIMLHELGHLLVAKRCGIKVTEYFVGFGPKLWSIRRGETEYGIKPVLLGGYVRIIGMNNLEEIDPADEARTYRQQTWWKRVAVSLAGPAVHFVLAFLLFFVIYSVVGVATVTSRVSALDRLANGQPSPAQSAGFELGDRIVSADGRSAADWNALRQYIQSKPGVQIAFVVERAGRQVTVTAAPADSTKITVLDANGQPFSAQAGTKPVGVLGMEATLVNRRTDPLSALGRSGTGLARGVRDTVVGVGRIFSPHGLSNLGQQVVTGKAATSRGSSSATDSRPVSVIGVGRLATQAAHDGLSSVLTLVIVLNLFLGVFNLIPLLPFDGGHVAIAIYERLRSRRGRRYWADITKMMPVTYALLMVVAFLGLSTIYLDLAHPIANPFR